MKYIYLKTNQRYFFMNTVILIYDILFTLDKLVGVSNAKYR